MKRKLIDWLLERVCCLLWPKKGFEIIRHYYGLEIVRIELLPIKDMNY